MKTLLVPERDILSKAERVAILLCGYHGNDHGMSSSLFARAMRLLRLGSICDNSSRVMDFYANPRSPDYLRAMLVQFLDLNRISQTVDLFVDEKIAAAEQLDKAGGSAARELPAAKSFTVADGEAGLNERLRTASYDAVIIVYADAIGLGCEAIEQAARRATRGPIVAVNGRRRAFRLDDRMRRALRWRRFLCRWRIGEWLLALMFLPLSAGFAAADFLSSGKR